MTRFIQTVLRLAFATAVVFALGFGTVQALDLRLPQTADCPPCETDEDCDSLDCCPAGAGGFCHVPSGSCICN